MSTRQFTDPITIANQVVSRLIDQVAGFNAANCFVSEQPVPSALPIGKSCCTVAMQDAAFAEGSWAGGGRLMSTRVLVVTPMVRVNLDSIPKATAQLVSSAGLLPIEHAVLKALLGDQWEPVGEDGRPILRDGGLMPSRIRGPAAVTVGESHMSASSIFFNINFDWDLS